MNPSLLLVLIPVAVLISIAISCSNAYVRSRIQAVIKAESELADLAARQRGLPLPRYSDGSVWSPRDGVSFTLILDGKERQGIVFLDYNDSFYRLKVYEPRTDHTFTAEQIKTITHEI